MAETRDRPAELLDLIDHKHGFGTVVVTVAGRRFACSLDDLREAIRRRQRAETETTTSS